ncbi:MAG: hypothetical protein ACXACR_09105, partial [Candidatus Hodarchaeales archaeon]
MLFVQLNVYLDNQKHEITFIKSIRSNVRIWIGMDFKKDSQFCALITTSRKPSHFLRRASKVISLSLPNSQKFTRGSTNLKEIFVYCWNMQIPRLIILQETPNSDIISISAYSIDKKSQFYDSSIKISNVLKLQKKDKKKRILVERVSLVFSDDVNMIHKRRISKFFQPITKFSKSCETKRVLKIHFTQEGTNRIKGLA